MKWFFVTALLLSISCQKQEKHPYTFYFWRTHLSLNKSEKEALNKTTVRNLYTRFFDIEKVNGKFQPVAILTKEKDFTTNKTIVPVVFIRNEVFYNVTMDEINFLAKNVFALIRKKQREFNWKEAPEIQIDCDWTAGTNKEYFEFLRKLKEYSGKEITSTLRLHQVKNSALSGIPPVDKVYLMCYSTSSPLENSDKNSILDVQLMKNYLGSLEKYPIKDIDIALPNYSWGIVTNHVGKRKLINALSVKHLENLNFKKINDYEVEVMKDSFYFGHYLNKGFKIKVEEISNAQLQEAKEFINKKLDSYNIIYYHLDYRFLDKNNFKP